MLDTAPDAFITLDRDGMHHDLERGRASGCSAGPRQEAIGRRMRDADHPAGVRRAPRHAPASRCWTTPTRAPRRRSRSSSCTATGGASPARRRCRRSRRAARCSSPASSPTRPSGVRRQAEREALLREQAARAEAERVAEVVGGMQALVDAALAQRSLDGILRDLVTQVRGVLEAERRHDLPGGRGRPAQRRARPPPAGDPVGEEFAIWVAESREAMLAQADALIGVPLLAEGEVTACWWPAPSRPASSAARTSRCSGLPPSVWALPSRTHGSTSGSTGSRRRSSGASCPTGSRISRGSRWPRATCPPPPRPRWAATGTT